MHYFNIASIILKIKSSLFSFELMAKHPNIIQENDNKEIRKEGKAERRHTKILKIKTSKTA